ncbi:hypothetical protein T439DRAFT_379877 [Meredithblackwellia eburnea MCA 4105]
MSTLPLFKPLTEIASSLRRRQHVENAEEQQRVVVRDIEAILGTAWDLIMENIDNGEGEIGGSSDFAWDGGEFVGVGGWADEEDEKSSGGNNEGEREGGDDHQNQEDGGGGVGGGIDRDGKGEDEGGEGQQWLKRDGEVEDAHEESESNGIDSVTQPLRFKRWVTPKQTPDQEEQESSRPLSPPATLFWVASACVQ